MSKNGKSTIPKREYLKVGQLFDYATQEQYGQWFTGGLKRHGRTEKILPRLVKQGKLIAKRYGKRLVYVVPRLNRRSHPRIYHGLGCTEGLVRFWRSNMEGTIIPERRFRGRGFNIVPEWGIKYDGKLLLYEFSTADNFRRTGVIQGKITRYNDNLQHIESRFGGDGFVLFVFDADRWDVDEFVHKRLPIGSQFFFTDYKTFLDVPIGEQLKAPIYIWGYDGDVGPLVEEENETSRRNTTY